MMSELFSFLSKVSSIAACAVLSACASGQSPTIEYLDELTASTITHSRTPFVFSTETPFDSERDYVQIGAVDVNRMGTHQHFIWLGISEGREAERVEGYPEEFESIVFAANGEEFQLDVRGWTPDAIGAGKPVYKKLFRTTVDAYYEVTIEQVQQLSDAGSISFRTVEAEPKEYVPWYRSDTAKRDLAEFLRIVSR